MLDSSAMTFSISVGKGMQLSKETPNADIRRGLLETLFSKLAAPN